MEDSAHEPLNQPKKTLSVVVGPFLFIAAIVVLLGIAISASRSPLPMPEDARDARAKAMALFQIGATLKKGMDRLTVENNITWGSWRIDETAIENSNDLFSPTGGGVAPPSTSLAVDPFSDVWHYPTGAVPGLGNNDQLAVLRIDSDICKEINRQIVGQPIVEKADVGDFSASTPSVPDVSIANHWPARLHGQLTGCLQNGDMRDDDYFYQVLYIN